MDGAGNDMAQGNGEAAGRGRLADVLAARGGLAQPEAPFVIEHREALIYMLCEAAELEHGIMCQYLFAAFSLKTDAGEGLTDSELVAVRRWRQAILHVASEEMLHLALVHNVLSAIGSAPHFGRPNLPAPAHHYPAGVNLTLVPFGEAALRHFMFLERPEGMELTGAEGIDAPIHDAVPLMSERDIVPRLQDFATVGHLYRSIEQGLARLSEKFGEENLFIGPSKAQASPAHFRWPELSAVTDLSSAQHALDTILEQGEGARGDWQHAHFGQFVTILDEYRQLRSDNARFEPVRPVMFATARPCEHDADVPLISERVTARCVDLFNVAYEILLLMFERYFAHTEESDAQLGTLADATVAVMTQVLAPLGGLITLLPVGPEHPGQNAGPSFELFYESDYLMPHLGAAWAMLEERLRQAQTYCGEVEEIAGEEMRGQLQPIGNSLGSIADSLAARFGEWGATSRFSPDAGAATSAADQERDIDALVSAAEAAISRGRSASGLAGHAAALAERVLGARAALASAGVDPARRRTLRRLLLSAVLGPLTRVIDSAPATGAPPVGDQPPTSAAAQSDSTPAELWRLAQEVTQLTGATGDGATRAWLAMAAAGLQTLAIEPASSAGVPSRAERVARLRQLTAARAPSLQLIPGGPYVAGGGAELRDWLGAPVTAGSLSALCRCGRSDLKPTCDGHCLDEGFDDARDPKRVPDRRDIHVGEQVTVFDNRGICQHSGLCTDRLASVFHTEGDPFVTASGERLDEIIRVVRACPSGALSYALGGREAREHVDWDDARAPNIEITRDGPYRVTGSIPLIDADGNAVDPAEGASHEHYSLCRCGQSRNKPFCSGMHWYVGFTDPAPVAGRTPTLFQWCGGMSTLDRLTSLFYEKHAAADALLAPLFATIEPGEPRLLARWFARALGAPRSVWGDDLRDSLLPDTTSGRFDEPVRARWVELMIAAADDAGLPGDPEFRAVLLGRLELDSRRAARNDAPTSDTVAAWQWLDGPPVVASPTPPIETPVPEPPGPSEPIGFDEHVRIMFRERDRSSMLFAFDLWAHADVSAHATEILKRLKDGSMPCDGVWPAERIAAFQRWIDAGTPATVPAPVASQASELATGG